METRRARSTLGIFVLRFAALIALTLAVLASVSVSASKGSGSEPATVYEAPDSAQVVNSRRYPLRESVGLPHP